MFGANDSQKVTELRKGSLSLDGNQTRSVKAEGGLTARPTSRAGAKAGLSDPTVPCGRAVAQRIKVTLGIIFCLSRRPVMVCTEIKTYRAISK